MFHSVNKYLVDGHPKRLHLIRVEPGCYLSLFGRYCACMPLFDSVSPLANEADINQVFGPNARAIVSYIEVLLFYVYTRHSTHTM